MDSLSFEKHNCFSIFYDWQFWLLFVVVNFTGNPAFTLLLPYKVSISLLFLFLLSYKIATSKINKVEIVYILLWVLMIFVNGSYTSSFSFESSIHIIMKLSIGIMTIYLLGSKIIEYYNKIIFILCIISLFCFCYNLLIGVLPYINIEKSSIDGGNIYRVSSILYTQLYNPIYGGLTFRNCGPFWEPGAYQGFLNLALFFEILYLLKYDLKYRFRTWIFIIGILTTFSTGGYIVLFLNLGYYLYNTKRIDIKSKMLILAIFLIITVVTFIFVDFLFAKISSDSGRLGVSLDDVLYGNLFQVLFGYGFSSNSIMESSINSASSVFNLIRYTGLLGLVLYFIPFLYFNFTKINLLYGAICILILMNEPFITAGPFWWGVPFICMQLPTFYNLQDNEYIL